MRVLLSTYGSRGDVQPLAALGLALQALGVEALVSAPTDAEFVELLEPSRRAAGAGLHARAPMDRDGETVEACACPSWRPRWSRPNSMRSLRRPRAAMRSWRPACSRPWPPRSRWPRSWASAFVYATFCPLILPSPHHPPMAYPGWPHPPEMTDNLALWELNAQAMNALFGEAVNTHRLSIGLPTVGQCARSCLHTSSLAGVGPGPQPMVADRPCRHRADRRLDPAGHASAPGRAGGIPRRGCSRPIYIGFGSMAMHTAPDAARVADRGGPGAGPPRDPRPRLGGACRDRRPGGLLRRRRGQPAGAVSRGSRRSCTMAAPERPQRPHAPARLRWWCPKLPTSPIWPAGSPNWASARRTTARVQTVDRSSAALSMVLAPETRERAAAIAKAIRSDGAMIAAEMLVAAIHGGSR